MSDLMDKIAALPTKPNIAQYPAPDEVVPQYEAWIDYFAARNALLCEVLNRCVPYLDRGMETLHSDIRAVLAACEVK